MIDATAHIFSVGRAVVMNGLTNIPFPSAITESQGGRIQLSGVFHPEQSPNDPAAIRLSRGLAFQQQWIGLNDEPDAVPLVTSAQPQLTGMYMVESASIDWMRALTASGGTVGYSARLRRVKPAAASAIYELQYETAARSVALYSVTPAGLLWVPKSSRFTDFDAATVTRVTGDGLGVVGGAPVASAATGSVGALQFGLAAKNYYQAACTIEISHGGPGDSWVPVQGTQIPAVDYYDVRITNDLVRFTWTNDGSILFERAVTDGATGVVWATVNSFSIAADVTLTPAGAPTVIRNSPESVTVRYPANNGAYSSRYVSVTVNRGDSFATLGQNAQATGVAVTGGPASTLVPGGARSDSVDAAGFGWVVMASTAVTGSAGSFSVAAGSNAATFGMGAYTALAEASADFGDVIAQWWLATGYTQRSVSL